MINNTTEVRSPHPQHAEAEFRAWRIRLLRRARVLCLIAVPAGLLFLPIQPVTTLIVSGLGLVGSIVSTFKLARLARR